MTDKDDTDQPSEEYNVEAALADDDRDAEATTTPDPPDENDDGGEG